MYGLRASVSGHSSDVRCLVSCNYPVGGGFLTGSRDKSLKLWFPSAEGVGYEMMTSFRGSTHWISSICFLEPDADNLNGLIVAGSFDSKIRVYDPISSEEKASYVGHGECVSALACNNKTQTVVSGSWDKNVKVWRGKWGSAEKKCTATISGQHQGSVLALGMLEDDRIVTGCADKLLRIFNVDGKLLKSLQGHTDVIQSLTILPDERLLSTGNDMKIRLWDLENGSVAKEFSGHTGFIYCVSPMPRNKGFITSGEDRSVRVWSWDSSEPTETIMLPAQSAWACTALTMGDIAVSLSDGTARVFTYRERFQAPAEEVAAFEESVAAMQIPAKALEDKMDISKLPKSLPPSGKKEGQTMMINEPSGVVAYQWSKGKWEKIGDVTGVSNKDTFEGKEYDFVFSVDVDENAPPLKLPYNLTEDPWRAAQKFINNNALPLTYLEQVANFIITNTAERRQQEAVKVVEPEVGGGADPLTGGSGYRPDYTAPKTTTTKKGGAADPFTGSGAYKPDDVSMGPNAPRYLPGDSSSSAPSGPRMVNPEDNPGRYIPSGNDEEKPKYNIVFVDKKFFPEEKYLLFDDPAPGVEKIINMLNKKCSEKGIQFEEDELKKLAMLCDPENVLMPDDIFVYFSCLMKTHEYWDVKFPLIDILRLALLNYSVVGLLCHEDRVKEFLRPLMKQLNVEKPASVQLLTMRCLVNLFRHEIGAKVALKHFGEILTRATDSLPVQPKPVLKQAHASLLLNFSIAARKFGANVDTKLGLLQKICEKIGRNEADMKIQIRLLIALGTLIHQDIVLCQAADGIGVREELLEIQNKHKRSDDKMAANVASCARKCIQEIMKSLQSLQDNNSMDFDCAGPSTSA